MILLLTWDLKGFMILLWFWFYDTVLESKNEEFYEEFYNMYLKVRLNHDSAMFENLIRKYFGKSFK